MFWLILALTILTAIDLAVQCFYARMVLRVFETKPPFHVPDSPPDPLAELVSFVTEDGVTLRGSIHRTANLPARGLVLFCPELDGSHWSVTTYARGLLDTGFDVFAFDFRCQGESDHQPGYHPLHWPTTCELKDVRAAMTFIQSREDLRQLPLGVMGVSRGSTPALVAAAETAQVKAVWCEGAYSTDSLLLHFVMRWATIYIPGFVLGLLPVWHIRMTTTMVRLWSQVLKRRRYVVLERWLPKLKDRSVQFVAGERDNYVHPEIGRELQRRINSPDSHFWLVPSAKHNRARHVGPAEYDRRLQDFFQKSLAAGSV